MEKTEQMISPAKANISGLQIGRKFRQFAFMLSQMLPANASKHNPVSTLQVWFNVCLGTKLYHTYVLTA